jgi:hypothetical protein
MACKSNVQFFTDGQPPNTPGGPRAHPRTTPEVSGRFVRSSTFTRQNVVNAPDRLKAELQTGAMRGCARGHGRRKKMLDNNFSLYHSRFMKQDRLQNRPAIIC